MVKLQAKMVKFIAKMAKFQEKLVKFQAEVARFEAKMRHAQEMDQIIHCGLAYFGTKWHFRRA